MPDGPEATFDAFGAAVETCRSLSRADGPVLFHCTAGVSRSCAVAAATLAAEEDRSVQNALDVIHAARPTATPHPALHRLLVEYLAWTASEHRALD